jgi:hypothetical protein
MLLVLGTTLVQVVVSESGPGAPEAFGELLVPLFFASMYLGLALQLATLFELEGPHTCFREVLRKPRRL